MFSKRVSWSFSANRLTRLLEDKREAAEPVLDLTESNPTRAGLDYPSQEILASLADPLSLVYEPSPLGLLSARRAVSDYYAARGRSVAPERILLTASTSEAYSFLFKLLADPGDRILIPRPSYPLFDFLASLESVEVDSYPLVYDGGWSIDLDALRRTIGPRTRAVLVVNPNNPTGSYLKKAELEHLIDICREQQLAFIADEVFSDYPLCQDRDRVSSLAGLESTLSFVLSGLSKLTGLPQMKLGWICAGGPERARTEALQRLEHISDTFLSVGTPVQHAAGRLFSLGRRLREAISKRLLSNHRFLAESIPASSPCQLLRLEGGWYAVLRLPGVRTSEEWALDLLARAHVLVHPGYLFDFPAEGYLVASLLTQPEVFQAGINRLLERVKQVLVEGQS